MHRLHNATVVSAAHDSNLESNERLAMLFEGHFGRCGRNDGGLTAPILFDFGTHEVDMMPQNQRG